MTGWITCAFRQPRCTNHAKPLIQAIRCAALFQSAAEQEREAKDFHLSSSSSPLSLPCHFSLSPCLPVYKLVLWCSADLRLPKPNNGNHEIFPHFPFLSWLLSGLADAKTVYRIQDRSRSWIRCTKFSIRRRTNTLVGLVTNQASHEAVGQIYKEDASLFRINPLLLVAVEFETFSQE